MHYAYSFWRVKAEEGRRRGGGRKGVGRCMSMTERGRGRKVEGGQQLVQRNSIS